jgi:hypothetical protein
MPKVGLNIGCLEARVEGLTQEIVMLVGRAGQLSSKGNVQYLHLSF